MTTLDEPPNLIAGRLSNITLGRDNVYEISAEYLEQSRSLDFWIVTVFGIGCKSYEVYIRVDNAFPFRRCNFQATDLKSLGGS
jgi:hypothetical protein